MLKPIAKGKRGWKNREVELAILDVFDSAKTPHTGWHLWQKLRRKFPAYSGHQLCRLASGLYKKGYLELCGCYDGDSLYRLKQKAANI